VSKSLVNLETNHLEFESEKLSLIAESIVNNVSNKKEIAAKKPMIKNQAAKN
jgi:hypothetical protein